MLRHAERITESRFLPPWLALEHEARYAFCRGRLAGRRVLDCGSGEGKGSRSMATGNPHFMIAMDRSVEAASLARTERILPLAGEAENIGLLAGAVDVVIALEVIEHFSDPEAFLAQTTRVLAEDGLLICSTPNRIVRNPMLPLSGRPLNPFHLREWTPAEFRELLAQYFGDVQLHGQLLQRRGLTESFNAAGRVWRRGAAILRQLAKFRYLLWRRPARYEVTPFRDEVDYEFVVAVCAAPRR